MYHFNRSSLRRKQLLCSPSLPTIRYIFVALVIGFIVLYISVIISGNWCDSEKEVILGQCNRRMESELKKTRKCSEEKSSLIEKQNDMQWEIEKLKRLNEEITVDNEKYNKKVIEFRSQIEKQMKNTLQLQQTIDDLQQQLLEMTQKKEEIIEAHPQRIVRTDNNNAQQQTVKINKEQLLLTANENIDADDGDDKRMLILDPETNSDSPHDRNQVSIESAPVGIPIIVFCYNRPMYLQRTLESIFSILPAAAAAAAAEYSVYISQDGSDARVAEVIQTYTQQRKVYHLGFDYERTTQRKMKGFQDRQWFAYHKIAAHYKWALDYILNKLNYDRVIVLEDDMQLAPDFFSYFHMGSQLLSADASIYCISAWNDFGQSEYVLDSKQLYRSDIFPGLGWMLTQALFRDELFDKWPLAFWDDWMREAAQRRNRSCVRPEVNRVFTFGSKGSSQGQFYDKYLKTVRLNTENIDWTKVDASYVLADNYDFYLQSLINSERTVVIQNVANVNQLIVDDPTSAEIRNFVIRYRDLDDFTRMCETLKLLADHKAGLPRQSYRGILVIRWNTHRLLFVPINVDWAPRPIPA